MDKELKALARQALANAFYLDYSALVNKYVEAAQYLGGHFVKEDILCNSNPYARSESAHNSNLRLDLYTCRVKQLASGPVVHWTPHTTVWGAMSEEGAKEVWLRGQKIFEKRDGEWYYTGE